jgi:hypothetical protein
LAGYAAVRECRNVQVERPSSSTSGGHSVCIGEGAEADVEGFAAGAVAAGAVPAAV